MSKFCSVSLYLLISIVLSLFVPSLVAQENAEVNSVESINAEQGISEVEVIKNEFDHLISANQVVLQLRKTYGVEGSVLLSKILWQILISYSNQQQAQNVWQTAINHVTDINAIDTNMNLSIVNSQYNSGQVLASYTNGMTTKKWNENRKIFKINKKNINDFFELADDLSIYLKLNEVWELLLIDIAKQEDIQWNDVFLNSLDLFVEDNDTSEKNLSTELNLDDSSFFAAIGKWQDSEDKKIALAHIVQYIESQDQSDIFYYQAIVRFVIDKSRQHYMATSQSWFAVAEQLYLHKAHLKKAELQAINRFIEKNDTWFLSKEQQLLAIDKKLPQWVESSFHQLKVYYAAESTVADFDHLVTVYQMIEANIRKYMVTPFRQKIHNDLEVCLNISEEFAPYPQQPIDDKQFKGCINDMVMAATQEASIRELSGSLTKIDTEQALDRALRLPSWQIINILYANVAQNDCLDDSHQLVNPLEWTLAAESLLWFADRWPAYMQSYPQNSQISKIIRQGENLIKNHPCLEKPKREILDAHFTQIIQSWENVKTQIKQLVSEFRQNNLTNGSDIDLLENAEKQSNYRVEGETIMACDPQQSCGVHVELESSRALFGLFPNHLLVADQLKLGSLKLCYDNVGWENIRSAPTHLKNDSVANYFGNFSFNLKGFYGEELIFERKLTDKQEYLYLFAENSEKVLKTSCPLSIVGDKISTQLKGGTYGLVPNRLTFLTASRANESKILQSNWSTGEEWRDKITTSEALLVSTNELIELSADIQQVYQHKAADLQNLIYQTMLNRVLVPTAIQQQLTSGFANMQRSTELFLALNYFLQMDELMVNDALHGILFGSNKIPDTVTIDQFYQNQININLLISSVDENLNTNKEKWNTSSNTLSNSHINNILFRLKSINP
ncbi:MAG: hypothetical protein JKY19_05310 [Alcanivoracaceae bacterium]|nr:hypothetical protein [Alcanivoracaceae bacterium]